MPSRPSTEQRLFGAVSPCGKPDERRLVVFGFVTRSRRSHEAERLRFISLLTFWKSLPGIARTAHFFEGLGGSARAVLGATKVSRPPKKGADLFAVAVALLSCCFNQLSVEMLHYNFTKIHPTSVKSVGGCHYDTPPCVQCSMFKKG